jgi:predicted nucleotidyltransferase
MRNIFTTSASSRFIDRDAVIDGLRECARRVKRIFPEIVAIHLFGSFATGTATPRSDADIVIEVASGDAAVHETIRDAATSVFVDAGVPVDLFVLSSGRLAAGGGVSGAVARESMKLVD